MIFWIPGGLLVDTLMDPVLTGTMLAELKPATGEAGNIRLHEMTRAWEIRLHICTL